MHHLVAKATWSSEDLLAGVRRYGLARMQRRGPLAARIVGDTGIPKKGPHSVGVARQSCGQLGKQANCQVSVSLSVATWEASLPVAWRVHLPEEWAEDGARRRRAGVPEEVEFRTQPAIALERIGRALEGGVPAGVVLAHADCGADMRFRKSIDGVANAVKPIIVTCAERRITNARNAELRRLITKESRLSLNLGSAAAVKRVFSASCPLAALAGC